MINLDCLIKDEELKAAAEQQYPPDNYIKAILKRLDDIDKQIKDISSIVNCIVKHSNVKLKKALKNDKK